MSETRKRSIFRFALPGLILLCLLMVALIHLNPGLTRYAYAPYAYRILTPDQVTEETTDAYAGVRRTYTFTLPGGSQAAIGARLSFYLRHTIVRAYIEDTQLIYDSAELEDAHIGKTPGNYWLTIPVRENYAGKKVHIECTPVFNSVRDETPVFYLIGHEQLLTLILLPHDALILVLCGVTLLSGLFLSLLAFIIPLDGADRRNLLLIGGLAVTAAVWKISGLSSVALLLDIYGCHKELWYLGALNYLLMQVLSLRYLLSWREDSGTRFARIICSISFGFAAALVLCQFFNVIELHDVLLWYGVGMAAAHAAVLLSKKPRWPEIAWTIPFFLFLCCDLAVYLWKGSMSNSPFFMLWVIVHLFIHGFGFVREAVLKERLLRERETELKNVKIQMMMQQIRPHFIYNTLSSIYFLCRDDPEQAMKVVEDFTEYLHANFTAIAAVTPVIFLDELRHTQAYLNVESIRYGDRLMVDYDLQHTAFMLPALTLQPIVENAVKYGVGKGQLTEHIMVRTRYENGSAVIIVEDDGPGFDQNAGNEEGHIGIENVRERLRMLCDGSLTIRSSVTVGTEVVIIIPNGQKNP